VRQPSRVVHSAAHWCFSIVEKTVGRDRCSIGNRTGTALATAKSKAYQAADAPVTLGAYKTDLENFKARCFAHDFEPMPAAQETVGAYLATVGLGYALPTLRRRVAALARAHRISSRHPRNTGPERRIRASATTWIETICGRADILDPLDRRPFGLRLAPVRRCLWMATYTLIPNAGQTFHIAIVGNDGARQTLLGFQTEADAEAWIARDRLQSTIDDLRMPDDFCTLLET
jgi:hypothetical protein